MGNEPAVTCGSAMARLLRLLRRISSFPRALHADYYLMVYVCEINETLLIARTGAKESNTSSNLSHMKPYPKQTEIPLRINYNAFLSPLLKACPSATK